MNDRDPDDPAPKHKSRLAAKWGHTDPSTLNRAQRQEYRADAVADLRERGVKKPVVPLPAASREPIVVRLAGNTRRELRAAKHAVTRADHAAAARRANKAKRNQRARQRKLDRRVAA